LGAEGGIACVAVFDGFVAVESGLLGAFEGVDLDVAFVENGGIPVLDSVVLGFDEVLLAGGHEGDEVALLVPDNFWEVLVDGLALGVAGEAAEDLDGGGVVEEVGDDDSVVVAGAGEDALGFLVVEADDGDHRAVGLSVEGLVQVGGWVAVVYGIVTPDCPVLDDFGV
jgi:hypothetical protein